MDLIKVQLPDGSVKEVARGTTPLEIAEGIGAQAGQGGRRGQGGRSRD